MQPITYIQFPGKSIEALSLSDYNHLRDILGFSSVSISNNEFLVHCDTWNYVDDIQQRLEQQSKITLNGQTLTAAETPILTEPNGSSIKWQEQMDMVLVPAG